MRALFLALVLFAASGVAFAHPHDDEDDDGGRSAANAVARYHRIVEENPSRPRRFDEVGMDLYRAGEYRLAGDAFLAAAARGEAETGSWYNAACARALEGRKAEALELLQKAIELGYTDAEHISEDEDFDRIRREPRFAELMRLADALSMKLERPWKVKREGRFGVKFDGNDPELWKPLLPKATRATEQYPNLGLAWFNRGLVELRAGAPEAAVRSYQRALELGFRKATSSYNLGCAYAKAGKKDEAFAALQKAIELGFKQRGLIRRDDDLDALRDDPRFEQLAQRAWDAQFDD